MTTANMALQLTANLLRSLAAIELRRYTDKSQDKGKR